MPSTALWSWYAVLHILITLGLIHMTAERWLPLLPRNEQEAADHLLWYAAIHTCVGVLTFFTLQVKVAPFGRHAGHPSQFVCCLPSKLSWCLQEVPCVLNVVYYFAAESPLNARLGRSGNHEKGLLSCFNVCGILLFTAHYVHRSLVYPLYISPSASPVPLHITLLATLYCSINGRLQVLGASIISSTFESASWLDANNRNTSCSFTLAVVLVLVLFAAAVWLCGFIINVKADYYLLSCRREASGCGREDEKRVRRYIIPTGSLFRYVACPNFLGELIEWFGYTLWMWATTQLLLLLRGGSQPSLSLKEVVFHPSGLAAGAIAGSFFFYTAANLIPRAMAHHQWYVKEFGTPYRELHRRAIVPFVL